MITRCLPSLSEQRRFDKDWMPCSLSVQRGYLSLLLDGRVKAKQRGFGSGDAGGVEWGGRACGGGDRDPGCGGGTVALGRDRMSRGRIRRGTGGDGTRTRRLSG